MAIHDLSGFGKCSLSIALPVLSAAGLETVSLPTAVLSTHTGGFQGYTYRDLTEDILPMAEHWHQLGLTFNALYSGFLGSLEQISMVSSIFDRFKTEDNLIVVDPAMADFGRYYRTVSPEMGREMSALCRRADIVIPNMTEAAFLVGEEYRQGPYSMEYIQHLLEELSRIGPKKIVLTGVMPNPDEIGAAYYDCESGETAFFLADVVPGQYHGTGDLFASAFLGALLYPHSPGKSLRIAVNLVTSSIRRTYEAKTDVRYGVNFEEGLFAYLTELRSAESSQ